jgi:UvrD-like helicase C-terminal domain
MSAVHQELSRQQASQVTIDIDARPVTYPFGELDEVVLAYATTIHKSQGSEYPAVVIPVATQHYTMLRRNLLYTGMTRGQRLVSARPSASPCAACRGGGAGRSSTSCSPWKPLLSPHELPGSRSGIPLKPAEAMLAGVFADSQN